MHLLKKTLSQIANEYPGATAVLHQYQLDFCCGGKQSLEIAIEKKGLNSDEVCMALTAIAQKNSDDKNWSQVSDAELIDHIIHRYHQVHRAQLAELARLAARVESVHGNHPQCPNGLAKALESLTRELEAHMQKEEQILFPMLAAGHRSHATGPINMMRHEHDDHALALSALHSLSHNLQLPEGACNTWRALYLGLEDFIKDIKEHIHLENNVLFESRLFDDAGTQPSKAFNTCCGSCGG